MRILVDKMPETPKECLFSKRNVEYGMVCQLQRCVCNLNKERKGCPCLKEQKEADNG